MGRLNGIADEPPLEKHGRDYRISTHGTREEEDLSPWGERLRSAFAALEFAVASGRWAMENPSAIKGIDSPRELKYLSNSLAAQTAFDAGNIGEFLVIGPYFGLYTEVLPGNYTRIVSVHS